MPSRPRKSGHPGMPMGMADIAEVLWNDYLRFNPRERPLARPRPVRAVERPRLDAAVLGRVPDGLRRSGSTRSRASASSARASRAIPSASSTSASRRRPGRSARASRTRSAWRSPRSTLAAEFNRPGATIVDHYTYVFLGDGCMMEGISHEACAFAGTQKLGKLIALLRRQRHFDRRRDARLVHGRHAEALRGVRLARRAERRRPRSRRDPRGDRRGARGDASGRR